MFRVPVGFFSKHRRRHFMLSLSWQKKRLACCFFFAATEIPHFAQRIPKRSTIKAQSQEEGFDDVSAMMYNYWSILLVV